MKSSNTQQKWPYNTWVIILLLILFFPVGIILAWKSQWSRKAKLTASLCAALIITFVAMVAVNAPPTVDVANMSPEKTLDVEDSTYRLEGKIYPYKAELTVNDKKVATDDRGKFVTAVQLNEGENTIQLIAKDGDKITEKAYKINRLSAAEIAEAKRIAQEKANKAKAESDTRAKAEAEAAAKAAAQQKAKAESDAKTAQQKTETPTPAPKPKSAEKTTMDKLWEASDAVLKTRKGVDIQFNSSIGTAQLFVTDGSEWSEKHLVQRTYNRFVLWGQKVNGFAGVQAIDVQTRTEFVDGYGNKSTATAVRALMNSEQFKKYKWNNFQAMPIHTQIQTDGTLYLQSSIKSEVNLNDAKLFL